MLVDFEDRRQYKTFAFYLFTVLNLQLFLATNESATFCLLQSGKLNIPKIISI